MRIDIGKIFQYCKNSYQEMKQGTDIKKEEKNIKSDNLRGSNNKVQISIAIMEKTTMNTKSYFAF